MGGPRPQPTAPTRPHPPRVGLHNEKGVAAVQRGTEVGLPLGSMACGNAQHAHCPPVVRLLPDPNPPLFGGLLRQSGRPARLLRPNVYTNKTRT